jgi:hypothetical protein
VTKEGPIFPDLLDNFYWLRKYLNRVRMIPPIIELRGDKKIIDLQQKQKKAGLLSS